MNEERPVLQTERVAGGLSPRLAAVVAVGALLGVVWLGVAGRPSDVPAESPPPAAQHSPVAVPTAIPPRGTPEPATNPRPPRTPNVAIGPPVEAIPLVPRRFGPLGEDAFAITFWLEDRFYLNVLRQQESGLLKAITRIPLYREMPTVSLQIIQLWTRDDRPPLADIATYELPLAKLLAGASPGTLLEVEREPRPKRERAPRLIREGYRLTVGADVRRDHAYLLFDLAVGEPTTSRSARPPTITGEQAHSRRPLAGRGRHDDAIIRAGGGHPPLILLVAQAGTPRGTQVLGHSWLAGY